MYPGLSGNVPAGISFGQNPALTIGGTTNRNTGLRIDNGPSAGQYLQTSQAGSNQPSAPVYDPVAAAAAAEAAKVAQEQADEQAYWQDKINSLNQLLGTTDTQLKQGISRIEGDYTTNKGRADADLTTAKDSYGTQRVDTTQNKMSSINQVDATALSRFNSLMQLLGRAGAGIGSVALTTAPQALSRQAGQQRAGVNDTFGRNIRDIGRAEGETEEDYNRLTSDLLVGANRAKETLTSNIEAERARLNELLGDYAVQKEMAGGARYTDARAARKPYQRAYNSRLDAINQLFSQYQTPEYRGVAVSTPNIEGYTIDPALMRLQQQNPGVDQTVAAYLPLLNRRRETAV